MSDRAEILNRISALESQLEAINQDKKMLNLFKKIKNFLSNLPSDNLDCYDYTSPFGIGIF